jgi:hypothetical protein
MNFQQNNSAANWWLGDYINGLAAVNGDFDGTCKAIGMVLGERAKDLHVVAEVAAHYPIEVRNEHEILSWGHFFRAMGHSWESNLDWMVKGVDELGRPASVDAFLAAGVNRVEHPAKIAEDNSRDKALKMVKNIKKEIELGRVVAEKESDNANLIKLIDILLKVLGGKDE